MASKDYLYKQGTTGQTKSVTSTRNRVFSQHVNQAGMKSIGVMSSFRVSQSRPVEAVRGIGYGDQIAELVPGNSEATTIAVTRTALYLDNLMQTFGYKAGASGLVRSLKHQKWPFDIRQEIVFSEIASKDPDVQQSQVWIPENPEGGPNNLGVNGLGVDLRAVLTIFQGCWMTSYEYEFSNSQVLVSETCNISVSDEYDGQNSVYGNFIDSGKPGTA